MRLKTCTLIFLLVGSIYGQRALAQAKPDNTITTAVPYLRLAADSRASAMGDIGVATSPDAASNFYNMGKAAFNTSLNGLTVSYSPWLRDLGIKNSYFFALSGFHKLDDLQAITLGVRYLKQGVFTLTDDLGNTTNTYSPSDLAIDAGYSRKLSEKLGLGLSLRYIHSKLTDNSGDAHAGNSVAADLGFYYHGQKALGKGWSFGAALTNLGSKISYSQNASSKDFIPANLGLGANYTTILDIDNKLSFGLDINKLLVPTPPDPNNATAVANYNNKSVLGSVFSSFGDAPGGFKEEIKEFQVGIGAEYTYSNAFILRAGYFHEDVTKGNRQYATVGAGLRYRVAEAQVSYLIPTGSNSTVSPLNNSFRLSLVFDFAKTATSK